VGNATGTISNSYATGNITAGPNMNSIGGLAGSSSTSVANSFATGSINVGAGGSAIGGLVGDAGGTIASSYATGGVVAGLGVSNVGGLVGFNVATITETYATGAVSGTTNVGGLVGNNISGTVTTSYWDTTTSGTITGVALGVATGATGRATAQMQTKLNFAGWLITDMGGSTGGVTWRIYEGQTGPLLISFLNPITVTANNDAKAYDGVAYSGGNGYTSSIGGAILLGAPTYGDTSQGALNAGAPYNISIGGLYSDQFG
jgi:hypothetical protein